VKPIVGLLIALVTPLRTVLAQTTSGSGGGGLTVGWARVADTSALEFDGRYWKGSFGTGPRFDGTFGVDLSFGHHIVPYTVLDADLGYAIGFDADATTCLVLRGGGSVWFLLENGGGFGENLGVEFRRHLRKSEAAWVLDLNWRRFPGLTLPSITVGLVAYDF